jgi:hypothetical protein
VINVGRSEEAHVILRRQSQTHYVDVDFTLSNETKYDIKIKNNIRRDEPISAFYWNYFKPLVDFNEFKLGTCARKVFAADNAGGNSVISEAMSAEILTRIFGANTVRTEMEVEYSFSNWKIADFTIKLYDKNVGISVTRAFNYISDDNFTIESAEALLNKKITGLVLARNSISERDSFYTSILHVFCRSDRIRKLLHSAYKRLNNEIRDNIIILCTVCPHDFIFKNQPSDILRNF